jgi:hypothetical protein
MASTISRFANFYVRESGQYFGIVKLRGGVCYPAGIYPRRAGPNRDHRCAVNLGLLDRAAGVSGGIATLPGLGELKVRLLLLGHQFKTS